MFISY